ncbi:hypothetical protein [Streptomyces sp. NPDC058579]|uniref:hypothetical protein n=1 Tax=Streptomyces sp. NPDC058579 TaxID=3346548 RepID=UPI00366232F4
MRKTFIATLATAAAVVVLGSAAVPAQAASAGGTPGGTLEATAGGTAPACIERTVNYTEQGFWVFLENTCGRTMRVQAIATGNPSSSCMTMGSGDTTAWYSYGTGGRYVRTVVC